MPMVLLSSLSLKSRTNAQTKRLQLQGRPGRSVGQATEAPPVRLPFAAAPKRPKLSARWLVLQLALLVLQLAASLAFSKPSRRKMRSAFWQ